MPELTDAQKVLRNDTGKRMADALEALAGTGGRGLPPGGTDGDVLVKNGNTDYAARWEKPQYYRPNMLDNWDFVHPINQRGLTTWQNVNEYTIDRWKLTSGSASLGVNGLTLNGTLTQKRETAIGKAVTCSALLADGQMITPTYNDSTKTFSITLTGQTIKAAKLELGSSQTLAHWDGTNWVLNEIPDQSNELRKCMRYYVSTYGIMQRTLENYLTGNVTFPVPMVATPTVTITHIVAISGFEPDPTTYVFSMDNQKLTGINSAATVFTQPYPYYVHFTAKCE